MPSAKKDNTTLDQEGLETIASGLQAGYSREAIYEELKPAYMDPNSRRDPAMSALAHTVATFPDLDAVQRHKGLLQFRVVLMGVLLSFKLVFLSYALTGSSGFKVLPGAASNWLVGIGSGFFIAYYAFHLYQSLKLWRLTKPSRFGPYLGQALILNPLPSIPYYELMLSGLTSSLTNGLASFHLAFVMGNLVSITGLFVVSQKLQQRLFPHLQELPKSDLNLPGKIFRNTAQGEAVHES